MGVNGNALDFSFNSYKEIPRILSDFAAFCVTAAKINKRYCPLASASLESSDGPADLIRRIKNITSNLITQIAFVDKSNDNNHNDIFTFSRLATTTRTSLMTPKQWPSFAKFLLDAE